MSEIEEALIASCRKLLLAAAAMVAALTMLGIGAPAIFLDSVRNANKAFAAYDGQSDV